MTGLNNKPKPRGAGTKPRRKVKAMAHKLDRSQEEKLHRAMAYINSVKQEIEEEECNGIIYKRLDEIIGDLYFILATNNM